MEFEELKAKYPVKIGEGAMESPDTYVVVVDEDKAYRMTAAAFYVWLLCDGTKTCQEILDKVAEDTKIGTSELEKPIADIITALADVGLVRLEDSPLEQPQ